jgi:hypothetical protein
MHTLTFRIQYEPHLAGGAEHEYAAEHDPSLHVHLTHGLSPLHSRNDGVVVVPQSGLSETFEDGVYTVDVSLQVDVQGYQRSLQHAQSLWKVAGTKFRQSELGINSERRVSAEPRIAASASVAVHVYVRTSTETGQDTETVAGTAVFLLTEILEREETKVDWQLTADRPLVKGLVTITNVVFERDGKALDHTKVLRFARPTKRALLRMDDLDVDGIYDEEVSLLDEHISRSMDLFIANDAPLSRSEPAYLSRMHCPYFQTPVGLLPGSVYCLLLPQTPNDREVYSAALDTTLARWGFTREQIEAQIHASSKETQPSFINVCRILVAMHTVYANYIVYLGDFANEGGDTQVADVDADGTIRLTPARLSRPNDALVYITERYRAAVNTGSDDCEGSADQIVQSYRGFQLLNFSASEDVLLFELQQLARKNLFVPALVLAGVTNKKQELGVRDIAEKDAMAHSYAAFIPTSKFLAALTAARDRERAYVSRVKRSRFIRTYLRNARADIELPVLLGEGTARADPLAQPVSTYYDDPTAALEAYDAVYEVERKVFGHERFPGITSVRMPNPNRTDDEGRFNRDEADLSKFYKANSALYTAEFAEQGLLDFAFAVDPEGGEVLSPEATHGLHFTRFAGRTWPSDIRLVPYNEIDPDEGILIADALAQLEPVSSLKRKKVVQVKSRFQTLERGTVPRSEDFDAKAMPIPPKVITLSYRDQDMTPEIVDDLEKVINDVGSLLVAVKSRVVYLADAPLEGEETPPAILQELDLFV